jgi:eukaryotic-like serine/threonine-protein kinase
VSGPANPFERFREADRVLATLLERSADEREFHLATISAKDPELGTTVAELLRLSLEEDALLVEGGALAGGLGKALASDASGSESDRIGKRVGPWRLVRELGRGGMAVVYLAERADGAYEQQVALKLLQAGPYNADLVDRFERERRILASLNHPHIARLIDGGLTGDGQHWFAMEYVRGERIDR